MVAHATSLIGELAKARGESVEDVLAERGAKNTMYLLDREVEDGGEQ